MNHAEFVATLNTVNEQFNKLDDLPGLIMATPAGGGEEVITNILTIVADGVSAMLKYVKENNIDLTDGANNPEGYAVLKVLSRFNDLAPAIAPVELEERAEAMKEGFTELKFKNIMKSAQ